MATGRKQIAFDLDTKALKKYYPSDSWNSAYDVIKRHMQNISKETRLLVKHGIDTDVQLAGYKESVTDQMYRVRCD